MTQKHDHERSDMSPQYILYFGIGLFILCALVVAGIWGIFRQFERQAASKSHLPPVTVTTQVPEPRLQVSPEGDLAALRTKENEILSTYAWVDRDKGVARIPIDRAMQLLIERQKK
jgi:hypothetical protein